MQHSPVYLRDLTPTMQQDWLSEIQEDPKLREAYDNGEDIIVGWYCTKAKRT